MSFQLNFTQYLDLYSDSNSLKIFFYILFYNIGNLSVYKEHILILRTWYVFFSTLQSEVNLVCKEKRVVR